ncbi:MAG: hypothetical protein II863_12870, partial [Kiritimatiellae bacterium]|nr:hypothetical protein [Kiritimatiellia bacterium]
MSARFFSRELPTYPPAIQRAPAPNRLPLRRPTSKKWDKGEGKGETMENAMELMKLELEIEAE